MSATNMSILDPTPPKTASAATAAAGPAWQDQDGVLRDMWMQNKTPQMIADTLGRSVSAIMTRAARLGLPRRAAPGRKPGGRRLADKPAYKPAERAVSAAPATEQEAAQSAPRICLMCLSKFQSAGRHNRICPACKDSAEYQSAHSLPEIDLPGH